MIAELQRQIGAMDGVAEGPPSQGQWAGLWSLSRRGFKTLNPTSNMISYFFQLYISLVVVGGFSSEPRHAGAFCPGFAKTSAAGVSQPLLHKRTLVLGECASMESLEVRRNNSDIFNTPSPRVPKINSPRPLEVPEVPEVPQDRLPDSLCDPTPIPSYTIDNYQGWTYVLESWFKNMKTSSLVGLDWWVAGAKGEVFTFTTDGDIEPTPDADSFPLHIMEGLPPEPVAVPQPSPRAAQQVEEPTLPGSGDVPTVAAPRDVENTQLDDDSPGRSSEKKVSPPQAHQTQSMYQDGTYWKKLISISRFDFKLP